jgi:hypothetical protein
MLRVTIARRSGEAKPSSIAFAAPLPITSRTPLSNPAKVCGDRHIVASAGVNPLPQPRLQIAKQLERAGKTGRTQPRINRKNNKIIVTLSGNNSEYNFGPNARSIRDLIGRQKFSAHAPAPGRGRQQQCGRAAEDGTLQQTAYCNSLGRLTDDGRNHGLSCPRDVLLVFVPAIKQETTQTVMDDQGHALLDRIPPRTSPRRIISIRIHEEPAAPLATCSTALSRRFGLAVPLAVR